MKTIKFTAKRPDGSLKTFRGTTVSRTKGAMVITTDRLESDATLCFCVVHKPTGMSLPGCFKSHRTAVRLAHGWWNRLTEEQREFFLPGRENYEDSRRQSDEARDWYMEQTRKFRIY